MNDRNIEPKVAGYAKGLGVFIAGSGYLLRGGGVDCVVGVLIAGPGPE